MSNPKHNWTERLENVLNDYDALQHFKMWMGIDDDSSEHPIRLHFAIKAFRERSENRDPRSTPLAREIYVKFLKPRTGLCAFIDSEVREAIGQRIYELLKSSDAFIPDLFDPCLSDLSKFLRHQHALFIASQEFIDFYNVSVMGFNVKDSTSDNCNAVEGPSVNHFLHKPFDCTNAELNSSNNLKSFVTPTKLTQQPQSSNCNFESNFCVSGFATTSRRSKKSIESTPKLTASSLHRSQRDRETALGQSLVEKLYKPVNKYPYIGQATTSKNDSAVSSSFSSDANGSLHGSSRQHHMTQHSFYPHSSLPHYSQHHQSSSRTIRDEQRRLNPVTNNFFVKPEPQQPAQSSLTSNQFDHGTKEGRIAFNKLLTRKLLKVIEMREADEEVERIANKQIPTSTREMIILSEQKLNFGDETNLTFNPFGIVEENYDDVGLDAVDDDVDNYFRCRMILAAGDSSAMNSQQQTPPIDSTASSNEPISCQHQNFQLMPKKTTLFAGGKRGLQKSPDRSAEFDSMPPSSNTCLDSIKSQSLLQSAHLFPHNNTYPNHQMSFPISMQSQQQQLIISPSYMNSPNYYYQHNNQFPTLARSEKAQSKTSNLPRLVNKPPSSQQQHAQHYRSCSPDQMASNVMPNGLKVDPINIMSQSCMAYSSGNPPTIPRLFSTQQQQKCYYAVNKQQPTTQRIMGFAPPPGKSASSSPYKDIYCDNDGDTSGIGTLTYISDASGNSDLIKKQRAAVFKKARELNAANSSAGMSLLDPLKTVLHDSIQCGANDRKNEFSLRDRSNSGRYSNAGQLINTEGVNSVHNDQQQITISYRRMTSGNAGVPTVAHVKVNRELTFKEFRRHLSIPSRDKNQYFFKTACEDGSAPYQLLLVNEESTILPIFEGKIIAECRSLSDSD